jgi:hypothetical protein
VIFDNRVALNVAIAQGQSSRSSTGRSWVRIPLAALSSPQAADHVDLAQSAERRFEIPRILVRSQGSTLCVIRMRRWFSPAERRLAMAEARVRFPAGALIGDGSSRSGNSIGRVPVFQTGCCGFDPHPLHFEKAVVAQQVEQLSRKQQVVGSTPTRGSGLVQKWLYLLRVRSSNGRAWAS